MNGEKEESDYCVITGSQSNIAVALTGNHYASSLYLIVLYFGFFPLGRKMFILLTVVGPNV